MKNSVVHYEDSVTLQRPNDYEGLPVTWEHEVLEAKMEESKGVVVPESWLPTSYISNIVTQKFPRQYCTDLNKAINIEMVQ